MIDDDEMVHACIECRAITFETLWGIRKGCMYYARSKWVDSDDAVPSC